jgi:hypothetical protein
MTRWHDPLCVTPNVFVKENQIPSCRACGQTCPPLEDLVAKQEGVAEVWELPIDESPGHMNLRWPQSVPYIQVKNPEPLMVPSPERTKTFRPYREPSTLYGATLKMTEFRLACLSAVAESSSLLHLTLEIFADDDHPEYECSSYSWGGEDGNVTLSEPVYIGEHWDVLMQTKNCGSMLRFLRPWRGVRMVWVDAVCINQSNMEERGSQVAKMRQIYEGCSRVIVYLGEDIVTTRARFPRSQPLSAFCNADPSAPIFPSDHQLHHKPYTLQDLFSRRYFSRVWVIQELVASERVLIRVGNIDYYADSHVIDWMTRSHSFPWINTPAPWMKHLAHKVFPVSDLLSLLKMTMESSASDPRDRLFGVVSLLHNPIFRHDVAPDYTLSFQHFNIGIFAHLLLREKRYWFLGKAGVGTNAPQHDKHQLPSWMPDCRSDSSWRELFGQSSESPIAQHTARARSFFPTYSRPMNKFQAFSVDNRLGKYIASCLSQSIDTASGALHLAVAHLWPIENGISMQETYGPLCIYAIHQQLGSEPPRPTDLLMITLDDVEIRPEQDHLFIPLHIPEIYLILRRKEDASFQLVTSYVRLFHRATYAHGDHMFTKQDLDFLAMKEHENPVSWSTVGPMPTFHYVEMDLSACIWEFRHILDIWNWSLNMAKSCGRGPPKNPFFIWSIRPPVPRTNHYIVPDILSLCLAIHRDEDQLSIFDERSTYHLEKAYVACVDRSFFRAIEKMDQEMYMVFSLRDDEWNRRHSYNDLKESWRVNDDPCVLDLSWRYEDEERWRTYGDFYRYSRRGFGRFITGRRRNLLLRTPVCHFMSYLQNQLSDAQILLRGILTTYDTEPNLESLAETLLYADIKSFGFKENIQSVCRMYYMAGVKIDGQLSVVKIV